MPRQRARRTRALAWAVVWVVAAGLARADSPDADGESLDYAILTRHLEDGSLEFLPLDRFPGMNLDPRLQAPGLDAPERAVIDGAEAWREFWKRANPELAARAAALAIDFSSEVVFASAAGARSAGAETIILDVLELPGEIRVQVEETPGTCPGEAATHPLAVVRAARPTKPVRFDVREIPCAE